jgi:N-acetylglucosaminyl-diphospho-decaprenol L-rhamnosyltransferase
MPSNVSIAVRAFPRVDRFPDSEAKSSAAPVPELTATPVLIVAYRNPADIVSCLAALCHARSSPAFEIFVCENGGSEACKNLVSALTADDGPCDETGLEEDLVTPEIVHRTVLRLRGSADGRFVHIGDARENLGYAGGVNAWLRPLMAVPGWSAAWVLNPDTQPAPDALLELAAYAERWGRGMVGSRLVPTAQPDRVHSRGLLWCKARAVTQSVDLRAPGDFEPDPQAVDARIDSPCGASMYVTRACIDRVGLMNDRYFLLYEDLEWGIRAQRQFGVGYAHRSIVPHAGGTTMGSSIRAGGQSELTVYLEYRNSILFVRDNFPLWLPWTIIVQFARIMLKARAYGSINLRAALRGLTAGIRGQSGRPKEALQSQKAARGRVDIEAEA